MAETGRVGLAAGRRLMLAAEGTGVLGLVLSREGEKRRRGGVGVAVAVSRWRVTGVPGGTRWRVQVLHCRGGRPAEWTVGWGGGGWSVLPSSAAPNRRAS